MIEVVIPSYGTLKLKYLVLDYNGTLAVDGRIYSGVADILNNLSDKLIIHVITADTFGQAKAHLFGVNCQLTVLNGGDQDKTKLNFIRDFGSENVVSIGNGRNDCLMLKESILGIAVLLSEGLALESMLAANIVCKDIVSALELFINPLRLVATLRS